MRWLLLFIALTLPTITCGQGSPLTSSERAELNIYREEVPKYLDELKRLRAQSQPDYAEFNKKLLQHKTAMNEVALSALLWQRFASNVVLFLVVILTVSGIALAAYQLTLSYRIGQKIEAQNLDVSAQKVQVTSSVVGITILVIAGVFLLLFLKDVYRVEYLENPKSASDQIGASKAE
jgi:hypothetical protein